MGPFADFSRLDGLAHRFFRLFSRFEYALKAAGFLYGEREVKADWSHFAAEIEEKFCRAVEADKDLASAVRYIFEHPPKKQVAPEGKLGWSTSTPQANGKADLVNLYVRRVRNNLFHGGKFNGHWFSPERSEELIAHSMTVLEKCVVMDARVEEAFNH